jgi:hypothetical protein
MKRSEALKIIDDTYEKFCADWLQVDLDNLEEFIPLNERILNALENSGMMPPSKEGVIKIQELENGELCIPIWEWESEDEEK